MEDKKFIYVFIGTGRDGKTSLAYRVLKHDWAVTEIIDDFCCNKKDIKQLLSSLCNSKNYIVITNRCQYGNPLLLIEALRAVRDTFNVTICEFSKL